MIRVSFVEISLRIQVLKTLTYGLQLLMILYLELAGMFFSYLRGLSFHSLDRDRKYT
jgi:hypothetical protein